MAMNLAIIAVEMTTYYKNIQHVATVHIVLAMSFAKEYYSQNKTLGYRSNDKREPTVV